MSALASIRYAHDVLFGRDNALNKAIWWWGRRHIDNRSIIASDVMGARQYFYEAFIFFTCAVIAKQYPKIILSNRVLTPIFSHWMYPVLPVIFIVGVLYKVIIGTRLLIKSQGENDMREAFKDILSEERYSKLPVISRNDSTSNLSVFIAKEEPVIVIQYWMKMESGWKQKTIAFSLDWDTGYGYDEIRHCEFSDMLKRETAFLLKELFVKGQCDYDPLTQQKTKVSLYR